MTDKKVTEVILTNPENFGVKVNVYNIKFNRRKKSLSFDTDIIANPHNKKLIKKNLQDEIFARIIEYAEGI